MRDQHAEILNIESEPEPRLLRDCRGCGQRRRFNGNFQQPGVDKIIMVASMNPSTEDFVTGGKKKAAKQGHYFTYNKIFYLQPSLKLSDKDAWWKASITQGIAHATIFKMKPWRKMENMEQQGKS